jgi:hypothetical protein
MQFRFKAVSGKTAAVASLALAFVLVAGTAFAALTFNSTAISSDGALTLNPTGQPVTVNGNLTVTGTCTGCGGGGTPGGSNTQIQFNNNGAFGGSSSLTWDNTNKVLHIGGATTPGLGTFLQDFPLLLTQPTDYAESVLAGTSDGFAGNQYDWAFVAKAGDTQANGSSATTGALTYIGSIWMQRENTTTVGSEDIGIDFGRAYRPLVANGYGDVGLGRYGGSLSGLPSAIDASDVFIMGDASPRTPASNSGYVGIGADGFYNRSNPPPQRLSVNGNIASTGSVTTTDVITTPVTVSGLPTCNSGAQGAHAFVTDANATTFNTTVAGGGSNKLPVFCDGTNWKIGG